MDADRLARLTEQQRACLRFVFAHMTSKEIAPHLGIAPDLVEREIEAAMDTLGIDDRRAAARMLAEHEGAVPGPPDLAHLAFHEDQTPFEAAPAQDPPPSAVAPPTRAGSLAPLAWIALAAIAAILAYAALR